ncbi:MAG TPA: tetratricopeptide repeat protein [Methylomirabilota bacterium]|nr:tetratricopeptide repeat protein [Methylomirabilota bacterium]
MRTRALGLLALWLALIGATPRPAEPPGPDLSRLVPFANAPLDKPSLAVNVPLPAVPVALPTLPLVGVAPPAAAKPVAFIETPRKLPCVGAWLGIATESLECGRARFQRGEYEEAAKALEPAVRRGTDRDLLREARYWMGETYLELGKVEQADWLFRQVAQDSPRQDWGTWALHSSGWTALRLGQPARARDAFTQLLAGPNPASLEAWGRHGLGLALMALGRYDEAEQTWTALEARPVPPAIARDVAFWHAEALGRKGDAARAETLMRQFTQGGPHPLLLPGQLRLGWWSLNANRPREADAAFRVYLAQRTATERDWAEAGLALARLGAGDWAEAQKLVAGLVARRSSLAQAMQFRVARAAVDAPAGAEPGPVFQQLLGTPLPAPARAWVLLVKGESDRAQGNRDEARTQFDLAQKADPDSVVARQAAVREALVNFELREFAQAVSELTPVLNTRTPPEVRRPALLLQGEAAYHAGDHVVATAGFRRLLTEFPSDPQAPAARLGVAWSLLRQGKKSDARRELLEFARLTPDHPHAPDGLVLASELALEAGDFTAGRELLDRIITTYPTHPRAEFARLNRGLLQLRAGDAAGATVALRDWLARSPFPALFGRAHAALGTALLEERNLDEAVREFSLAQKDGLTAFGHLGLGAAALARRRTDDAEAAFKAARDAGTPAEAAAATYGLAAAAFQKGAVKEFKQPALASLAAVTPGPPGARRAGTLLYALTTIAVEEKDWPTALGYARRLTTDYAAYEATPDALERVGAGAAAAAAWPIAYESTILLRQRYPKSPLADDAALRLAEAQLETGRPADARRGLEQFVASSPNDPRAGRAWIALARAREQSGDRGGALEAYSKAPRDTTGPEWSGQALFSHARLLLQDKRYGQARGALDRLLKSPDTAVVVDAAQAMGEAYTGEGDHLGAAEYYLTAAYVAPDTPAGRRGLLSAARALAASKQEEAAATAYRKLLAQADLAADVRDAARKELAGLRRP